MAALPAGLFIQPWETFYSHHIPICLLKILPQNLLLGQNQTKISSSDPLNYICLVSRPSDSIYMHFIWLSSFPNEGISYHFFFINQSFPLTTTPLKENHARETSMLQHLSLPFRVRKPSLKVPLGAELIRATDNTFCSVQVGSRHLNTQ